MNSHAQSIASINGVGSGAPKKNAVRLVFDDRFAGKAESEYIVRLWLDHTDCTRRLAGAKTGDGQDFQLRACSL